MIKSFKCKEAEKVWREIFSKKLPHDIQEKALEKLIMLDSASSLSDLKVPPNNKLEALKGDRKGQYSIRINQQFRVCFQWMNNEALDVEIVDYH